MSNSKSTTVVSTPELPIERIIKSLTPIGLDPCAISLAQPVTSEGEEPSHLYYSLGTNMPSGARKAVVKALQRAVGDNIKLIDINQLANGDMDHALVLARPVYKLLLVPAERSSCVTTTLAGSLWKSASLASRVFKVNRSPRVPFRIVKAEDLNAPLSSPADAIAISKATATPQQYERIVSGVVLEPDTIDGSKTIEGGRVLAEGDTYSAEEIRKAMYWWMENGQRSFSYHHVLQGGRSLNDEDITVLENWQTRVSQQMGEQAIKEGTWMLTARIYNEQLWDDILNGVINSWSIGADVMGAIEDVPVPATT